MNESESPDFEHPSDVYAERRQTMPTKDQMALAWEELLPWASTTYGEVLEYPEDSITVARTSLGRVRFFLRGDDVPAELRDKDFLTLIDQWEYEKLGPYEKGIPTTTELPVLAAYLTVKADERAVGEGVYE
mgnify:CR=1 FL=1